MPASKISPLTVVTESQNLPSPGYAHAFRTKPLPVFTVLALGVVLRLHEITYIDRCTSNTFTKPAQHTHISIQQVS